MSISNGNAAYDLSIYDRSVQSENKTKKHVKSSKAMKLTRVEKTSSLKMPSAIRTVVGSLGMQRLAAIGFAFMGLVTFFSLSVTYRARENELTNNIEKAQKNLTTLCNDYEGLMVQYDTRMSNSAIEEYASEKLGMHKRENYQLEWITIDGEQDFENGELDKSGFIDIIASYFD